MRCGACTLYIHNTGEDGRGTMEFAPTAYNYNTLDDTDPRNLVLLATTQGVAVQQDGKCALVSMAAFLDVNVSTCTCTLHTARSSTTREPVLHAHHALSMRHSLTQHGRPWQFNPATIVVAWFSAVYTLRTYFGSWPTSFSFTFVSGRGAKRLLHHAVDKNGKVHRYWLEAERSDHAVGGAQMETEDEREDATSRGKATVSDTPSLALSLPDWPAR